MHAQKEKISIKKNMKNKKSVQYNKKYQNTRHINTLTNIHLNFINLSPQKEKTKLTINLKEQFKLTIRKSLKTTHLPQTLRRKLAGRRRALKLRKPHKSNSHNIVAQQTSQTPRP